MAKAKPDPLRTHLLELLGKGGAHADYDRAVADLAPRFYNTKATNIPHSAWDQLEHMRIAQADILAFSQDARHKSPIWPDEYWPTKPATPASWKKSIVTFKADRDTFVKFIKNPKNDLLAPIPHSEGQTPAREAMLLADHTAYHLGQLILLRRHLGAWRE
jgi:hypothetical protein